MGQVLFRDCSLLDVAAGEARPGHHVLVEGDRIAEVSDREISAREALRLDLRGRTLMPGLIDAHVHAAITTLDLAAMERRPLTLVAQEARRVLEGMLARGFTSVRDAGGADWGLAEAVERGLVRGPRLFFSGRVLSQTGGHGDFRPRQDFGELCACRIHSSPFSHVADGVPAVRRAAREELRRGASQVKLMASGGVASPSDPIWNLQYSAEEMRAIVEEAEGWRTYAMAHAYTPEAISRAVDAGVRSIEHGNLLDEAAAKAMKECGAYLVPTLATYAALAQEAGSLGLAPLLREKLQRVQDRGVEAIRIAKAAGVPIAFGTDLLGAMHARQTSEYALRRPAMTPVEILQSATCVAAEVHGRSGELGAVEPGALADLLVLEGDPTRDLAPLEAPEKGLAAVMKGGRFYLNRLSRVAASPQARPARA
jgi:imidazolonepropionase-like amidohydrolase